MIALPLELLPVYKRNMYLHTWLAIIIGINEYRNYWWVDEINVILYDIGLIMLS